jgi:hypothetical protein
MQRSATGQGTRQREDPQPRLPDGWTIRRTLGVAVIVALALSGCSGDGSGGRPTSLPTELPTSPSITLPSVTLPTVTLPTVPSVTLPTVTLPTLPTATLPEATASPEFPAELPPAPEVPAEVPPAEATETATAAPAAIEQEGEETEDDTSGWLWLLLLLIGAAGIAAVAGLIRRRRAQEAWAKALDEPLQEAMWLRDSIVPNLLAQSPDGRAGVWAIARLRVLTLEQRLADLVPRAPEPATARPLEALSAAVQALREVLDHSGTIVGFGGASTTAALHQSQSELNEAIRALQTLSAGAERPLASPQVMP